MNVWEIKNDPPRPLTETTISLSIALALIVAGVFVTLWLIGGAR